MKTVSTLPFNLSPKAVLAFFYPLIGSVVLAGAVWISDGGPLDWAKIRVAVGGTLLSGLALLGAYIGKPTATTG